MARAQPRLDPEAYRAVRRATHARQGARMRGTSRPQLTSTLVVPALSAAGRRWSATTTCGAGRGERRDDTRALVSARRLPPGQPRLPVTAGERPGVSVAELAGPVVECSCHDLRAVGGGRGRFAHRGDDRALPARGAGALRIPAGGQWLGEVGWSADERQYP